MGLYSAFLLFTIAACQIQFNNGTRTPTLTADEIQALWAAWIGPPFNETDYKNALAGTIYSQPGRGEYTAQEAAKSLETFQSPEITDIPEVTGMQLEEIFLYIRYTKLVRGEQTIGRRLTWLYPDEGCECKAEMALRAIYQKNMIIPKKIFVFGKPLEVATENTVSKKQGWAHHIALIYRVGRTAYVLDPSLDDKIPFTLKQWNNALSNHSKDLTYSICAPTTFGRESKCYDCPVYPQHLVLYHQLALLPKEWERLEALGRFPERELATCAPYI